jgi:hypothetical protein
MTHRLLHVGFAFRSGPPKVKTKDLEPVFDKATDWYRYAPNCWLLWTTGTPDSWVKSLKQHISDNDYIFIVEVKATSYQGWLPEDGAVWLKKHAKEADA